MAGSQPGPSDLVTALCEVVAEHGPGALCQPAVISNLMKDVLPEDPRMARVMIVAAEERVGDQLSDLLSQGVDAPTAVRLAAVKLAAATMFPEEACAWATSQIAAALGALADAGQVPMIVVPRDTPASPAGPGTAAADYTVADADETWTSADLGHAVKEERAASTDDWKSLGVDIAMPNVARIYDYFLGGRDNFAADRAAATTIVDTAPDVVQRVKENRAFLGRAVRFAAEAGIRQFIDVGTGLPTRNNVHQVAQQLVPEAHVVYVDNDPVVLVHARALLATDANTIVVDADMREPATILRLAQENGFIDLDQPVAVLMVAVLHFLPDIDQAAKIVATFRQAMAPGSYLVISHGTAGDMSPRNLSRAVRTYATTSIGSLTMRSPAEIASFFDGLELQEPGLVPVAHWRPEDECPATTSGPKFLSGVARKT